MERVERTDAATPMLLPSDVEWVVLTTGSRPTELERALASLGDAARCVVFNGAVGARPAGSFRTIDLPDNVGVPGGRDIGCRSSSAPVVGFLDDDAVGPEGLTTRVASAFRDRSVGAVSFRLVDEDGVSNGRHVPRPAGRGAGRSGDVASFLGGACAIRREAYEEVGGYFTDLFYGHEEVELSWRLIDAGWRIRYLADVEVFHPRTDISRHDEGWRLTGRNRVLVARRSLPWAIAIPHVTIWLLVGTLRAARQGAARPYLSGWRSGWSLPVTRRAISWRGVLRLAALGRPPIV